MKPLRISKIGGCMQKIWSLLGLVVFVCVPGFVYAQEASGQAVAASGSNSIYFALAAAFAIGIAAFAGAFAQSRAASSALEGIARNPEAASKIVTPMIIALALIESLVIYALVIAFLIQGKI